MKYQDYCFYKTIENEYKLLKIIFMIQNYNYIREKILSDMILYSE